MEKQQVRLSEADREALKTLVSKGKPSIRVYKRALGLLDLDRGKTLGEVAQTVGVTRTTVGNWRDKYIEVGLGFLQDAPRSGRPIEISGEQRAQITALACSQAPEGHARWDLRLLADKIVELEYCEHISHTQVSNILKKTNSNLI
ncbi:MAG: helix-turn-helix domain-containing protein [Caldilineaceae bacterium]